MQGRTLITSKKEEKKDKLSFCCLLIHFLLFLYLGISENICACKVLQITPFYFAPYDTITLLLVELLFFKLYFRTAEAQQPAWFQATSRACTEY